MRPVLLLGAALFAGSYSMELAQEETSLITPESMLQDLSNALLNIVMFDQAASLPLAITLSKEEYIRQHYKTLGNSHLFQTCFEKIIKDRRSPRHLNEALSIMIECDESLVQELTAGKVFMASQRMSKELFQKLLERLQPTDKFMAELVDITGGRGNELDVEMLLTFLTWSFGKVSNEVWVDLLNDRMPSSPSEKSQLLHALLPFLIKNVGDLKDKIRAASNSFSFKAEMFLMPILRMIHTFMYMTQLGLDEEGGLNEDFWLPKEIVQQILSMHSQFLLQPK